MPPRRPRLAFKHVARFLLVAAALAGALWLARLDFSERISTNIADLIPRDERQPELNVIRSLVNDEQARVLRLVLTVPDDAPDDAAVERFLQALRADPAFAEALRVDQMEDTQEQMGPFLFEHRWWYLLPDYLERRQAEFLRSGESDWTPWLAGRVVDELDTFLQRPESSAFEELVPRDPLLLLPRLADAGAALAPPSDANTHDALLFARLHPSPLEEAGQTPVFQAVESALASARELQPELELQWTGLNRLAAASKARIRSEITWLNSASVVAVLLVTAAFVYQPWRVLHLLPVVVLSLLGAWVAVTAIFPRVHILVFVVGALLSGAAIDYGFHLYLHAAQDATASYRAKLRAVLKPLLVSCLTTIIGFSILWFSELPLLRHVGVFVSAGLITALLCALLYFAQLESHQLASRRGWRTLSLPRSRGLNRILAVVAAAAVVAGLAQLRWHDDIRELEVPAPELTAIDQTVRARFGETGQRPLYLVTGDTVAEARARLAALEEQQAQPGGANLVSAGVLLPTPAAYAALPGRLAQLESFPQHLSTALSERGYDAEAFAPFLSAWPAPTDPARPTYDALAQDLRPHLQGPAGLLLHEGETGAWFVVVSDQPLSLGPDAPPGIVEASQLRTLNRLFQRYRQDAIELSLIGLALVAGSVFLLYGWRDGWRVVTTPFSACVVAFALLGWAQHTLNLFHLLGAFLGVCLSHDYAIFAAHHRRPGEAPPASVRLAALTTAASFGVLAFSRIPVIAALGTTVSVIVLVGLLVVELQSGRERIS